METTIPDEAYAAARAKLRPARAGQRTATAGPSAPPRPHHRGCFAEAWPCNTCSYGGNTISTPISTRFFAAVEQRDDPRLRGRPVIVGGGVVLAASYEAKALRRPHGDGRPAGAPAVPARDRRRRRGCRPTPRRARRSSRSSSDATPLVEGLSIDEAFLDVRGLRESSRHAQSEIAVRLRRDVLERVGLPITVGIARTKFLAKVASGVGQARRPAASCRPTASSASSIRCPSSASGASGRVTAGKLAGARTATQSARSPRLDETLARPPARSARPAGTCTRSRNNRDPRPVQTGAGERSIGSSVPRAPAEVARGDRRDARRDRHDRVARRAARGKACVPTPSIMRLALRRLLPRDALVTLPRGRPARPSRSSRRHAALTRGGGPADPAHGLALVDTLAHESPGRRPRAARRMTDDWRPDASTPRSTSAGAPVRRRRASRALLVSRAGIADAATPGLGPAVQRARSRALSHRTSCNTQPLPSGSSGCQRGGVVAVLGDRTCSHSPFA